VSAKEVVDVVKWGVASEGDRAARCGALEEAPGDLFVESV
jgi:hypothetical protein